MALMNITVNADTSTKKSAVIIDEFSGTCETLWVIKVVHDIGDTLNATVSGVVGLYTITNADPNYIINTNFISTIENEFHIIIQNSGTGNGTFYEITLQIQNITTSASSTFNLIRTNDLIAC